METPVQVGDIEAKLNEKEKQLEALVAELNEAKAEQENSSRMESELDTLQKQIESLTGRPTSEGKTKECEFLKFHMASNSIKLKDGHLLRSS